MLYQKKMIVGNNRWLLSFPIDKCTTSWTFVPRKIDELFKTAFIFTPTHGHCAPEVLLLVIFQKYGWWTFYYRWWTLSDDVEFFLPKLNIINLDQMIWWRWTISFWVTWKLGLYKEYPISSFTLDNASNFSLKVLLLAYSSKVIT